VSEPLLSVRDLSVEFQTPAGRIRAVDRVSFDLGKGETLALVGESGCGKSTLARAMVGLVPPKSGSVRFAGQETTGKSRAELRPVRQKLQLVFQDPHTSLNPRLTISTILEEPLLLHGRLQGKAADSRVCELLEQVGLDPALRARYPHEFSGGQRQRISVARALAVGPELLLCDEVTSALDVSVQAQMLELLSGLQARLGLSYLFITHDLGVVRSIAHRIAVMYLGQVVELSATEPFFENPLHPYSQGLLSSIPRLRVEGGRARSLMQGEVPSPARPPPGCRFHTRCPRRFGRCSEEEPQSYAVGERSSRCFLHDPAGEQG
jgi:oligopeptide/dipeptide ABC transporter ATP-binding protein